MKQRVLIRCYHKRHFLRDQALSRAAFVSNNDLPFFFVQNERWDGVPFMLRCGKALNERKAEVSNPERNENVKIRAGGSELRMITTCLERPLVTRSSYI